MHPSRATANVRLRKIVRVSSLILIAFACWRESGSAEPIDLVAASSVQPATIVCLGDSVTGVYYHTGGLRAYPEMLELALRKTHPDKPPKVINAGISGHATPNGLERLDRDVLNHKPQIVTISFGLNDMVRVPPEAFRANLEELARRCQAGGARVVLCTPNAVLDTSGRPIEKLVGYCDTIRAVAREKGLVVCDQFAAGQALRAKDAWSWRLTLSDEIHPNMDGHKAMAAELAFSLTGRRVSLDDVGPPLPVLPRTTKLLKDGQPVRVLAMPPVDKWIAPALQAIDPKAQVEVTTWNTAGKSLVELEKEAQATVRAKKPDLVLLAVPRAAAADSDEAFVRAYSWIMNWSLSFGIQEWDCVVVHPAVAEAGDAGSRDALVRRLVGAQHLHLVDRPQGSNDPGEMVFKSWVGKFGR